MRQRDTASPCVNRKGKRTPHPNVAPPPRGAFFFVWVRYLLYIITLTTFLFSQDTTPPYIDGANFTSNSGTGELIFDEYTEHLNTSWSFNDGSCCVEDCADGQFCPGSGVQYTGIIFTSPLGEIHDFYCNNVGEYWGSWLQYFDEGGCSIENSASVNARFNLPYWEVDIGTYDIQLYAIDFAGNEIYVQGDDFDPYQFAYNEFEFIMGDIDPEMIIGAAILVLSSNKRNV